MEHYIQGKKVLIDKEDENIFQQYKWHINDSGYVVWRGKKDGKKQTVRLHRLIAKPQNDLIVDHINRNKLDNRRSNLRCVSQAVNANNSDRVENAKGYYHSNSKCRRGRRWVVDYHGVDNTFETEEEAKKAVESIKSGTFIKYKDVVHKYCQKCGEKKEFYGSAWVCRKCALKRMKEYYQRKKGKSKNGKT